MDEPVVARGTGTVGRALTSSPLIRPSLEVWIGSNIFRNTNGIIAIHGKEQLVIETNREQGPLFITLDLYNSYGTRIAHLRRNALTLNESDRFAVEVQLERSLSSTEGPSIRLTDRQSGGVVLAAAMTSERKVSLFHGTLYSHRGIQVEITPNYCRIGSGTTRFGEIIESRGGPVNLG
ncbi:MAG: hypothetical protein AB7P24_15190 [Nitrospira sp.]